MKKKFIFISSLIFACVMLVPQLAKAATAESVAKQIEDTNAEIQALEREIKQYQEQISATSAQSNTLANLIKELTLTRNKLLKETTQTEKKITATGMVIGTLEDDIDSKEASIERSREVLGIMFRDLSEQDNRALLAKVLTQENLSEASREYNGILTVNEKLHTYIIELGQEKEELALLKNKKEGEKQNLTKLKTSLVEKKTAVDITKKEKDTLLAETKNQEAAYKKLLEEREKKKEQFENELENYEAQLQFILNPKSIPKTGSGALSWPLDKITITSHFAERWGRFHYGTDFRASVGTPVKAMASGEVLGTGDTDLACKGASFGKWVFIKYDNGLSSTYGHLSSITSRAGQKVKAGDVVALSGNTGSSTGPHLHVSVYASEGVKVETVPSKSCNGKIFTQPIAALNAYLNPVLYLPK